MFYDPSHRLKLQISIFNQIGTLDFIWFTCAVSSLPVVLPHCRSFSPLQFSRPLAPITLRPSLKFFEASCFFLFRRKETLVFLKIKGSKELAPSNPVVFWTAAASGSLQRLPKGYNGSKGIILDSHLSHAFFPNINCTGNTLQSIALFHFTRVAHIPLHLNIVHSSRV